MTEMQKLNMEDLSLPQILLETCERTQGLVLLTGIRSAGLASAAQALRSQSVWSSKNSVFVHGPDAPSFGSRGFRLLPGEDMASTAGRKLLDAADFIAFEGDLDESSLENLLRLSEGGRQVLLLQTAPGPLTALRRVFSLCRGEGRRHLIWRFTDMLLLMVGRMALNSLTAGEKAFAHEVILSTPHLREILQREDFVALEELLRVGDESSGTVSFNQSLLQLLLRRRIDVKTAFDATRDPSHLDQILKKVGI